LVKERYGIHVYAGYRYTEFLCRGKETLELLSESLINQGQIAVLANLKGITRPKFIQLGQKFIQKCFFV